MLFFLSNMPVNPTKAPNTKSIHVKTQADIEVSPSTLGELLVMLVKMLIKTRNNVTSRVMRPGTISGGMRKLAYQMSHDYFHKKNLFPEITLNRIFIYPGDDYKESGG